jgi:hypothetical protein
MFGVKIKYLCALDILSVHEEKLDAVFALYSRVALMHIT